MKFHIFIGYHAPFTSSVFDTGLALAINTSTMIGGVTFCFEVSVLEEQANNKNPGTITAIFFNTSLFIQIPFLTNNCHNAGRKYSDKGFFGRAIGPLLFKRVKSVFTEPFSSFGD